MIKKLRIAKKRFCKAVFFCCLTLPLLLAIGCSGVDSLPASEVMTKLLMAHSWKIKNVTVGGTEQTSLFKDMTLNFSNAAFIATNGGVVWPASGTWKFMEDNATSIKRSDDVVVVLTDVTETTLVLTLTWTSNTFGPGRTDALSGVHVFTLTE